MGPVLREVPVLLAVCLLSVVFWTLSCELGGEDERSLPWFPEFEDEDPDCNHSCCRASSGVMRDDGSHLFLKVILLI